MYDMKDYEKAISDMKSGKTIKAVLKWESDDNAEPERRGHH